MSDGYDSISLCKQVSVIGVTLNPATSSAMWSHEPTYTRKKAFYPTNLWKKGALSMEYWKEYPPWN